MAGIAISVLGPLCVVDRATGKPVGISRDAHRRLLTIFALAGGGRVPTDVLIERFWDGNPPASARTALQTHISALRRILPDDTIVTEGHGYALAEDTEIDAVQVAASAAAAHRHRATGDWDSAVLAAESALERFAGEPYETLDGAEFVLGASAAVAEQRALMEEVRVEALVELGRHDEALPLAEAMVHEYPLREHGWELLARVRAAAGRCAEALRAIQEARRVLADAGLEPGPGLRAAEQQILLDQQHDEGPRHNLPTPASSFVGRTDEIEEAGRLLLQHRLVTITGTGGVGKSRLALEVARGLVTDDGIDECWLVELAVEHDAADVSVRVADALGLQAPDSIDLNAVIARAVARRRAIIVLDNCEHLITAAATIARLIVEAGPEVRVLATSRIPLGVPGELVFDVPPLRVPPEESEGDDADDDIAGPTDAVTLFVERARLVRPGLQLTGRDLSTIGRLCRHLDGLPLAIELAAGRMRTLGLDVIADRAIDRLRFLSGGAVTAPERHRTMTATIAWSFDLLGSEDRSLLTRMAVFRGAVGAEVIEHVCGRPRDDQLDAHLEALVTQSLVSVVRTNGPPHYRLLETVREYAWSQLESEDEREQLIAAHRDYFVELADSLRVHWVQPPEQRIQPTAIRWWIDEQAPLDDVRAALETSRRLGLTRGVPDLAGMLAHVAAATLRHRAAVELLDEALRAGVRPRFEALLRSLLATQLGYADENERARREIDRAVELVADTPASLAKASVLSRASLLSMVPYRPATSAVPPALEAMATAEELGIEVVIVRVRALVVTAYAHAGRVEDARREYERLRVEALRARDPATNALAIIAGLNIVCYVGGEQRRIGGGPLIDEALEMIDAHPGAITSDLGFNTMLILTQIGRYAEAEAVLSRLTGDRYEHYEQTGARAVRARLRWFQGRLDEAAAQIDTAITEGVEHTWKPTFYSTGAEVAAARGRLSETRSLAAEVLDSELHPAAAAYKTSVLRPLVQAEVDAALAAAGHERERHAAAAMAATDEIRSIGASLPTGAEATSQLERWTTYLALAEAELARLDDPTRAVDAWRAVLDLPDTRWYRDYAARRLAEAENLLADRQLRTARLSDR